MLFRSDLKKIIKKVLKMQRAGFSIGIFMINHPKLRHNTLELGKICKDLEIDFRTKEFLGYFNGRLYGTYKYPGSVGGLQGKKCLCRTSELIINPQGDIYRCHHDLYNELPALGNILDNNFKIKDSFRTCNCFGDCNPCDVKIKTNRLQVYGHTSVQIKRIGSVYLKQ